MACHLIKVKEILLNYKAPSKAWRMKTNLELLGQDLNREQFVSYKQTAIIIMQTTNWIVPPPPPVTVNPVIIIVSVSKWRSYSYVLCHKLLNLAFLLLHVSELSRCHNIFTVYHKTNTICNRGKVVDNEVYLN